MRLQEFCACFSAYSRNQTHLRWRCGIEFYALRNFPDSPQLKFGSGMLENSVSRLPLRYIHFHLRKCRCRFAGMHVGTQMIKRSKSPTGRCVASALGLIAASDACLGGGAPLTANSWDSLFPVKMMAVRFRSGPSAKSLCALPIAGEKKKKKIPPRMALELVLLQSGTWGFTFCHVWTNDCICSCVQPARIATTSPVSKTAAQSFQ